MKLAIIITSCVAFLGALGAFVVLTVLGKDTTAYIGFVSMASGTLVAQIVNLLKTTNVETATNSMQSDIAEVKKNTNGPLATAVSQISEVHEAVVNPTQVPPEKS